MITIPGAAFSVFFSDVLTIRPATRAGGELEADVVSIGAASVSDPSTDPATIGAAEAAWKYTIEFPVSAWTATQPPAPGAIVDAGARWPELSVAEAYPLGNVWHLVCSAREMPQ